MAVDGSNEKGKKREKEKRMERRADAMKKIREPERTIIMSANKARDTVLIVGATGSIGIPIVAELLRRGHKLRLFGRSKESFTRAGYLGGKSIDIVICKDVTDPTNYRDTWFTDVTCLLCVARP